MITPPATPAALPAAAHTGSGTALRFEGVEARYRDRVALTDLNLAIDVGERVALVGANGAGKSTVLRVAAGTVVPSAGRVHLLDHRLDTLDRLAIARRLGVVPQATALPFATRVEEVVALGRIPHEDPFRGPRPVDHAAVAAAIDRVGIADLVGRDARELSLGERQLVLIAMAVAQRTPILLLDEPTVHLDLRHQVATMELLSDLNERDGTTVVAVLHDLALAAHFFPRIVIVDHGRIVANGPPGSTLDRHHVRTFFGVDPGILGVPPGGPPSLDTGPA